MCILRELGHLSLDVDPICSEIFGTRSTIQSLGSTMQNHHPSWHKHAISFSLPAALLFLSGGAVAQVSIYGLVDNGIRSDKTVNGRMNNPAPGGSAGSRWGFRASEDLGRGLKINANIEGGFL